MKKSGFLQNSKDMLSKNFKPAKCKTSLKLAASRTKLLKNKKEVQVKQMKRELAQLLESGQDQTARIRVEHVIREEKMMAAYDLIEIYSELIVARLPIIETQKNCPIDLKEAITSLMFASPRCGDIPELLDVKKQFTAKYGKEFSSAAIELRPDCGVSRMLVEKLSAKAPDGQTKIKVLTAIAEEHNIKWDPNSFGENETLPSNDLLNGPSTFEKANKMHDEAPHLVTPDVQPPPSHQMMHNNRPLNYSGQNESSSQRTEDLDSAQNSGQSKIVSSTSRPERRPSEATVERAEVGQSHDGEGIASTFGHHNWNMDFEDATAAAQAAAESAERASMAARAAAELSSRGRISRQYSPEAQNLDHHVLRNEGNRVPATSKFTNEYIPKESANSHHADRQPRLQNDHEVNSIEQDNEERKPESTYWDGSSGRRCAQTASLRSRVSSEDGTLFHNLEGVKYQKKSIPEEEEFEAEIRKQDGKYETDSVNNHLQKGFNSEKVDYFGEERIRKPSNIFSSSSHSTVSVGDSKYANSGHQVFGYDSGDNPSDVYDGHIPRETSPPGSHDAAAVIFDNSGSDSEDLGFGMGSQHNEDSKFSSSSPLRNPPAYLLRDVFDERKSQDRSESEFFTRRNSFPDSSESLEASTNNLQPDDIGPVTFDDSDGPSSEGETDTHLYSVHETKNSSDIPTEQNQIFGSARSSHTEMHKENNQKTVVESSGSFGFHEVPTSYSSPRLGKSKIESNDVGNESYFQKSVDEEKSLESSQSRVSLVHEIRDNVDSPQLHRVQMDDENPGHGKELNFEKLKGGFRQKGHTRPPYMRSQLGDTPSTFKREAEESHTLIPQSDASPAVERFASSGKSKILGDTKRSRVSGTHTESESDSSEEEFEKRPVSHRQEPFIQNADKNVKAKSNLRGSVTFFDSGSSDSENDLPKQVFSGKGRVGGAVSRRTKASPSSTGSISESEIHASSGVIAQSDSGVESNQTTSFYGAETPPQFKSRTRHLGQFVNSKQRNSSKVTSKTTQGSNISLDERRKSSREEWRPSSKENPDSSKSTESQKLLSEDTISKEDSEKKAGHVHPKLPDYDTLAARLQAIRMERQ